MHSILVVSSDKKQREAYAQKKTDEQTIDMNILVYLKQATISEKMKFAQDLAKDKEQAIEWLKKMITITRLLMLKNVDESKQASGYITIIQSLQKAYSTLNKTNVNV